MCKFCPSQAITSEERKEVSYQNKWSTGHEKCYAKWQEFGSNCGLCVSRCPFSARLPKDSIEEYIENPDSAATIINQYKESLINNIES